MCVQLDIQKKIFTEPINTYARVAQWSMIVILIIMTWIIGLETKAIEFSNAFAQDDLKTPPVYMSFHPRGNLVHDTLLRLEKSIYGQSEALRLWFDKLSKRIEDRGFKTSIAYPFMFMSDKVIWLVYVDYFSGLIINSSILMRWFIPSTWMDTSITGKWR